MCFLFPDPNFYLPLSYERTTISFKRSFEPRVRIMNSWFSIFGLVNKVEERKSQFNGGHSWEGIGNLDEGLLTNFPLSRRHLQKNGDVFSTYVCILLTNIHTVLRMPWYHGQTVVPWYHGLTPSYYSINLFF